MPPPPTLAATFDEMLRERLPNLLRLYLNPFVTQACHCLERYARTTWPARAAEPFQSFLANSFEEALGGAIKLARYDGHAAGRPSAGLVIDPAGRLGSFASAAVPGGRVEFVPGLTVVNAGDPGVYGFLTSPLGGEVAAERRVGGGPGGAATSPRLPQPTPHPNPPPQGGRGQERNQESRERTPPADQAYGFVVIVPHADGSLGGLQAVARRAAAPLVIACVSRDSLAAYRRGLDPLRDLPPDVVVFDESFADRAVPFAAFAARRSLYAHWNAPGKSTFHSTTYQPNTVSSLHFLRCLEAADPAFWAEVAPELDRLHADVAHRGRAFARLYSPSLGKLIRATGFDVHGVRTAGDFIEVNGRRVFDAVSGVACSVRGHNPPGYTQEVAALADVADPAAEVAAKLRELTGLGNVLPAVSGAGGIEAALRLALVANHPKRTVLALKSGFGGKSLLALAGTASTKYKERIDPLYPDVVYVDPFAPDALAQIDAVLAAHPVAVAQTELVQGVGGVREVPAAVLRHLAERRADHGYLLLVDEVQTGMHRTGPFVRSRALGLSPDLLVVGKGTSDMMFPFAVTLYSDAVRERLAQVGSGLPDDIRRRHGYDWGDRTLLNVLRRADELNLTQRVAESGELFARELRDQLASVRGVRDVRAFGLLVGVELDVRRGMRRWLRKQLYSLYLLTMLRHPTFPVLAGFCQYEPNVLKLTPGLTASPDDLRAAAATIGDVLRRPLPRVVAGALGGLAGAALRRRTR